MATDKEMQLFYDNVAIVQRDFLEGHNDLLNLLFNNHIKKKLNKINSLLDIGFGSGYLMKKIYFELNGEIRLFGIDIAEKNVKLTAKIFENEGIKARFIHTSIANIHFEKESFDAVIASEVIEHLPLEILMKGLTEVQRVLKKGGYFFVTTPADEDITDLITCPYCTKTFQRWGHVQSFSKNGLNELLSQFFKIKKFQRWNKIPSYVPWGFSSIYRLIKRNLIVRGGKFLVTAFKM